MAAARVARVSPRVTSFGGARLDFPIICMGRMARLFPSFYRFFFRIAAEPVCECRKLRASPQAPSFPVGCSSSSLRFFLSFFPLELLGVLSNITQN